MAHHNALVLSLSNMNDLNNAGPNPRGPLKGKPEALFGPNIGIVPAGPAWTNKSEKKVVQQDELTADVVRGWTTKSKESQVTTTLQALVNLKRPTIRLSPLSSSTTSSSHDHHHGLEFEYDASSPKCGIYVSVLLAPSHPESSPHFSPNLTKTLVFESVVEGGFGKKLTLDEGAVLELARFEHRPAPAVPANLENTAAASGAEGDSTIPRPSKRRFSNFHFRKRGGQEGGANANVSGPALAVVDAESSPNPNASSTAVNKDATAKEEEFLGVRVTIRLAALDEYGAELGSPNEQVTYLEVVRLGAPPEQEEGAEEEDTRSWVVRVVKREATIGPHTFHLHEIYGLTSKSNHTSAPTAPLPSTHTYPPPTDAPPPSSPTSPTTSPPVQAQQVIDDDPSAECLLCLSSPREVVLLPCRHLVACKDCAINMVEFGAGGTITQPEENNAATPAGGDDVEANANGTGGDNGNGNGNGTADTIQESPITIAARRRKRRAKGWFCPVCRQPYTSLLRITTNPPPPTDPTNSTKPEPSDPLSSEDAPAESGTGGGLLGFRPGFLRQFSMGRNTNTNVNANANSNTNSNNANSNATDLERGQAQA